MRQVDEQISICDKAICKLIETFDAEEERGFLSQNILNNLRTFVEAVSVKAAGETEYSNDIFKNKAKNFVASRADLRFLSKFHKRLQESKSHYATDEEVSERLMLKYYEYLLRTKSFLKSAYNIDVLNNIGKFPLNTDHTLSEYYQKISEKINNPTSEGEKSNIRFSSTVFCCASHNIYPANDLISPSRIAINKYEIQPSRPSKATARISNVTNVSLSMLVNTRYVRHGNN